jgi:hypothetical protein
MLYRFGKLTVYTENGDIHFEVRRNSKPNLFRSWVWVNGKRYVLSFPFKNGAIIRYSNFVWGGSAKLNPRVAFRIVLEALFNP